ncbi:MAG TPA: hypothetical protein VK550_07720 [Polyangiaceae bacterium]|nr:hypothetical protein [Polyangiaceae bacterium]
MRNLSVLALSLLVLACSGDDDTGGQAGSAGRAGDAGSGGSGGSGTGGSATGGSGGSGGATAGGSGGSTTGGSGGSTGGAAGKGGTGGGAAGAGGASGGVAGSAGAGTGGSAGSAGSGTVDAGTDRGGGTAGTGGASADSGIPDSGKGGTGTADVASDQPPGACPVGNFPAVTDFSKVGPFTAAPAEAGGANCTIFRPTTLGENGVKHPVIAWGNGTGGIVGVYTWILSHWATHGFIVAAANTGSAGTGNEMTACLDWVEQQNSVAGSVYEGKVAVGRAGVSGHSQGGGGTLMVGRDPRILATAPVMPYTQQGFGGFDTASITQQHGMMLLLSALNDTIAVPAQNQAPVFMSTNVPVFWGTLASGNHVTFSLGGNPGYLAPTTAWFRMLLMCDDTARPMFYGTSCTVCTDTANWTVQRKGI